MQMAAWQWSTLTSQIKSFSDLNIYVYNQKFEFGQTEDSYLTSMSDHHNQSNIRYLAFNDNILTLNANN